MTQREEFYGLQVPLERDRVLVPRSCIQDVLVWQAPVPMVGAPVWYLGTVAVGRQSVPVISLELVTGQPRPPLSARTRIALFRCLGSRIKGGLLGVVAQGFPQLLRLTEDGVRLDAERHRSDDGPVLAALKVAEGRAWVPDFEYIEQMIADETSVSP